MFSLYIAAPSNTVLFSVCVCVAPPRARRKEREVGGGGGGGGGGGLGHQPAMDLTSVIKREPLTRFSIISSLYESLKFY